MLSAVCLPPLYHLAVDEQHGMAFRIHKVCRLSGADKT